MGFVSRGMVRAIRVTKNLLSSSLSNYTKHIHIALCLLSEILHAGFELIFFRVTIKSYIFCLKYPFGLLTLMTYKSTMCCQS